MPAPNRIEGFFKTSNLAALDNGSLLVDVDVDAAGDVKTHRFSEVLQRA
jgi:hypothetical protein